MEYTDEQMAWLKLHKSSVYVIAIITTHRLVVSPFLQTPIVIIGFCSNNTQSTPQVFHYNVHKPS